jgi:hypothetical protein
LNHFIALHLLPRTRRLIGHGDAKNGMLNPSVAKGRARRFNKAESVCSFRPAPEFRAIRFSWYLGKKLPSRYGARVSRQILETKTSALYPFIKIFEQFFLIW